MWLLAPVVEIHVLCGYGHRGYANLFTCAVD